MDKREDKRGLLDETVFTYRVLKDGKIFIYWQEKQVTILRGGQASAFLAKMEKAADEKERQLIMAKATGNFKRGNEK